MEHRTQHKTNNATQDSLVMKTLAIKKGDGYVKFVCQEEGNNF